MERGNLSISAENIMPIIKKWLYSDTDIFLRELVSNGSDAVTKLKKLADMGEVGIDEINENEAFKITVIPDRESKTIKVSDNGIGMTKEEIDEYINQIAISGATAFVEKYKDNISENQIIGHFGLGFYSAFMVSEKVTIETKSYRDEPAVLWSSHGTGQYEITESSKIDRGTEITLYILQEHEEFLSEYRLREILTKYCSFMPTNVFLKTAGEDKELNPINKNPLWIKSPTECTDDEYKTFYKETFSDYKDPLFWIHLNIDYPFNLKGILYFPPLRERFEHTEGQVKLFCNQVFVADNVKEVVPEFLLLLKGIIDCPDIPLNVSRSFLQKDATVTKMIAHISRKVAEKLVSLHKTEKESYTKNWHHISPFIKYGCMKDKNFYEKVEQAIVYKTTDDNFVTLEEYLADSDEKIVYYASDLDLQSLYVNIFKKENIPVVVLDTTIDSHFISYVESYNTEVKFTRIDSDIEFLQENSEENEEVVNIFKTTLGDSIKIAAKNLKDTAIPALITQNEESRRIGEMAKIFGNPTLPLENQLVINTNNPLISSMLSLNEKGKTEELGLITEHIYDLATLGHRTLNQDEMSDFLERSNRVLELVTKGMLSDE